MTWKNNTLSLTFKAFGTMAVLFIISGCYGTVHLKEQTSTNPETLDQTSVDHGKVVYRENCQVCHGQRGQGDGPKAPQFDPVPSDLTKEGLHITTTGFETIIDYPGYSPQAMRRRIRHGSTDMPEFKNEFTEKEIKDIISYIRYLELSSGSMAE